MANDLLKQFMSEANEAQENVQKKALQKAVQTTSSPTTSGKSKLDKKKKQQNKKATGAGVKTSAVGADTLNAAKDIAKTQEKKLPTKRNGSGKASVQKQETAKKVLQHLKEVSKPIVKTAENYDANPYTKEKTDAMWNRMATGDTASDKFGRVYAGVGQGVVDANLAIPNLIGKLATGKDVNLQERTGLNIDNEALKETAGFNYGKFAGEMIGYGMQNVAAAPSINGILANTKLGQMAAKSGTKMATNTRIGKLVGEEAAKDFTTGLARNAVEAGTVGLAQNIGIADQEGRTGLDLVGNVLLNTAADLTFGGLMEGVGLGINAVKGAKALRKATGEITEGVQTKTLPAGEEVPVNAEKVAVKPSEPVTEVAENSTKATARVKKAQKAEGRGFDFKIYEGEPHGEKYKIETHPGFLSGKHDVHSVYFENVPNEITRANMQELGMRYNKNDHSWRIGANKATKEEIAEAIAQDTAPWMRKHNEAAVENRKRLKDLTKTNAKSTEPVIGVSEIDSIKPNQSAVVNGVTVERSANGDWYNIKENGKIRSMSREGLEDYLSATEPANAVRKAPRTTERSNVIDARNKLMKAEMQYEDAYIKSPGGDFSSQEEQLSNLKDRLITAEKKRLPNGVEGRKLSNPSTVELPKAETQLKGTGSRKLKANGVPEVHEKVNGFDVESSNIGIVDDDLRFVGEVMDGGKGLFEKFKKGVISGQKELENLSKAAGSTKVDDYTQAVRNKRGTVAYIFQNGLVDSSGKQINDKSFKNLVESVPTKVRGDFNTYAQHLHNIDRVREGKPVFKQYSAADSQQIVDDMLKKHPEFATYTQNINKWWREFVQAWLVDTGRLTQDAFDNMNKMYPNYIPTYRVGKGVASADTSLPNRFNAGSGVKKAKGGTSDVLPFEDNFLAQIERIVSSTKKNDLYKSIIGELEANPEQLKQFGVLTSNKNVLQSNSLDLLLDSTEKTHLQEVKNGVYMLTAYRDGKPVSAYINKDMADALKLLDDAYGSKYARGFADVGKIISNPMKAGITGYNPLFALSNAVRDLPTLYIQSQHSMWKTTTGLGKAIQKMATNDDLWKQYKALGGKQSGYYAQGKGFTDNLKGRTGIKRVWDTVEGVLSALGEVTESAPRFAEFINSVEKYGDNKDGIMRALKDAAESTVNFSRSAPVTKTMDAWMLYLNAAIQGLDKFGRTVKSAPLKTLGRSAAIITVPYAALMIANWDNPHYHDLNERTKQNYFCIPNVIGETDSEGNPMTFIKLPLNREYGALLGSSLDLVGDYMRGEEDPFKGYKETLTNNFMPPINPVTDNILSPILHDLPNNADFAGRAIVPQSLEEASAVNQYDGTTSGAAKWIADKTNAIDDRFKFIDLPDFVKSPKKLDFLIDSYGGYIGQELQAATSAEAKDASSLGKETITEPIKSRFAADPRYSSGVVSDFYDAKDAAKTAKVDSELAGNDYSEAHARYKVYTGIADQLSDLSAEERAIKNNKSLSKNQKTEKINALRAKKNELARGAEAKANAAVKEYKQSPTYSALNEKIKEKYDSKSGLNKETFGKAYNAQKDLDTTAAKSLALLDSGVKTLAQAQGINSKVTEASFEKAKALKNAKISATQFETAAKKINSNKDSYYSVEEITSYLNTRNDLSNLQKRAIFAALSNSKNNPY